MSWMPRASSGDRGTEGWVAGCYGPVCAFVCRLHREGQMGAVELYPG